MKKLLLLVFTCLVQLTVCAQEISVKFPLIMMGNLEQKVIITTNQETTLRIELNGETRMLLVDGVKELTATSREGEQLTFTINNKPYTSPSRAIPLWMSIVPPILAILLAFLTKEIIISLIGGILFGTATIGYYSEGIPGVFTSFFKIVTDYHIPALTNTDHASILIFTLLIGGMVAVISKNGGVLGLVSIISKFAQNAKSAQLTSYFLGLMIFFDDYMNSLVIGNTMRPILDKMKVSREKLSYIVDSTSAPLVAISLIGVWIGAELDYIQSGVNNINTGPYTITQSPFEIMISSLSYSFYPILTLGFVFMLIMQGKDYGAMYKFEQKARTGNYLQDQSESAINDATYTPEEHNASSPNKWFALIPILTLVITVMAGIIVTGYSSDSWNNEQGLLRISTLVGNSNSFKALLWASFFALTVAVLMSVFSGRMKLTASIESALAGIKDMVPVSAILILSWCLAILTDQMHTADFVITLLNDNIYPPFLPAIIFILAGIIAFSTGTSWGTMAILYPIALPASYVLALDYGLAPDHAMDIFLISVASVLAGAVFGDHCSPVSDTTIISSIASGCNHINHVQTQIPYALTVAGVAIVFGILPAGFQVSSLITMPAGLFVLYLIITKFGKRPMDQEK